MEHLDGRVIILILFVVISAVKWLIEKFKNQGEQPDEGSESLEDIYDNFREEIRQRQTTPQQQQATHSPPPIPQSQPVVQHVQKPQPTQVSLPKKPKKRTLSSEDQEAVARFQQHSTRRRRQNRPQTSVHALLSNPHSTRQAIILTEILGKPKSMQDA